MKDIRSLLRKTESFIYDDLPTKDPETGSLTVAGLIPRLDFIIKRLTVVALVLYLSLSAVRTVTTRALMFNVWHFFDTSVSPAFEIVQITQSWGDYTDMAQAAQAYVIMIGVLFCYCSVGTITTEKYESVRDAAWASDWLGTPVSYQRCILFIIAESDQEFTFTAGKFVPISYATMMN
ncbi:hypothetical protein ANN_17343, partial [Periplaneta americana]